ncbi:MAG TPA: hypothetical protein PLQ23_03575, partial [Dermatophilaceae bacterium]|nr:hypothetical protein [Dermatophilaceae bacterium]
MDEEWLRPPPARVLSGAEPFSGCDANVQDFWRFAMADLRTNNVRGYLAEFLVAHAVGAVRNRVEWDAFDVLTPEGVKVEVKSSAYLQVWEQRRLSRIQFTGLRSRTWTPQDGESAEASLNADVYVFAVHLATRHDEYDPLDVTQWQFYVVPRARLEALGQGSLSLWRLRSLVAAPVPYNGLAEAISTAAASSRRPSSGVCGGKKTTAPAGSPGPWCLAEDRE